MESCLKCGLCCKRMIICDVTFMPGDNNNCPQYDADFAERIADGDYDEILDFISLQFQEQRQAADDVRANVQDPGSEPADEFSRDRVSRHGTERDREPKRFKETVT